MHQRRTVLTCTLALLGVWALTLAGMAIAQSFQPTPEAVVETVSEMPLAKAASPQERAEIIGDVVKMMNQLTQEERQSVRVGEHADRMKQFFDSMTPEERATFVQDTLPAGIRQMIDAFEQMSPEDQTALVKRAMRQLGEFQGDSAMADMAANIDPEFLQVMIKNGIAQFKSGDGADNAMQLQPVIEQIQALMQSPEEHHRRRVREHFQDKNSDEPQGHADAEENEGGTVDAEISP